ncbi:HNH endonuclease signature motif containing protein [Gordonia hydrophobica]|uniref:DUF222 domain-containing protein n=1 Tax=Gordonia hydrophobica TaxID=40516 RepID=A0ABZ2TZU8_9ACTN|nr:HNH endonuclease signature motif containing protein [Gordonia hydrophobica]MBM7369422.1 hypothetical protein [Gordonia hydrophobica]
MNTPMQLPDDPVALASLMDAVAAKFAAARFAAVTEDELVTTAEVMESARRRLDGADAAMLVEISDRNAARKVGLFSVHQFLAQHLRVGDGEAKRRRIVADAIGQFSSFSGGTLDPRLPATATAVVDGAIGGGHVREIAAIMDRIPSAVDPDTRARAEAQLAAIARDLSPAGVAQAGHRLLAHLDPDGQVTDDRDRARLRGLILMPQDRRLMSKVRAQLSPELRANLEVLLGQWAALGMNNPEDLDSPRGAADAADPVALAAAAARDTRTAGQRNHDALLAILQTAHAASGVAADRLSTELVVTVTDQELAVRAGVAVTATGTRLPVTELVHVAGAVHPHLAVFSAATGQALWLGRGRRLASKDQRLMLFARDRGCTAPECSAPFARTEAHHLTEWRDGGATDIGNLGAACGRHNRSVGHQVGQWETTILLDGPYAGRVAWRPVPADTRRDWRVNQIHHAELLPDLGPHAPPAPHDSRVEAHLARLLTA